MLRVPGSKVKYFRDKTPQVLNVIAVLGFVYCGILLVLAAFQDYILRILPYSQHFWARYSRILLLQCTRSILGFDSPEYSVLKVFKGSVPLIRCVLAVFRHLVLLIRSIFGVFQDFILRGAVILAVFQGCILRGTAGEEYYSEHFTRMLKYFGV